MAVAMPRPKTKATKIAYAVLGKPLNIANPKVKKEYKDARIESIRQGEYYAHR